ncbi:hypothetical protein [Vibrio jasicida]|uniref:hypothetical protein n=1 Tax=Vibrio jasicida TaxID=766224 RepID=UPI0015E4472B|nr:hypothetical protein [Vibrio jasicida]
MAAKGNQPETSNSTSLPNEATQLTFNKHPVFPTKAQNNAELPRQLPSQNTNWLRPKSDFEPVKHKTDRHDLTMKQPTNIGMFYGLSDSRI